jgi:hypothetical protein
MLNKQLCTTYYLCITKMSHVVYNDAKLIVASAGNMTVVSPNVLPSQSEPPINYVYPGDRTSPTGWTFATSSTFRVLDGDIPWGQGLRTPDGAATYNVMQQGASYMQATLTNLQIGATYQIRGYAASRPGYPVGARFDINLLTTPIQILGSFTLQTFTFDPFDPVEFTATAATEVLEFHGRGGDVLIKVLSVFKI